MSAKSLFPHQQLNWLSINLEKDLGRSKDKVSVYNQLALVHMSMALFHDGDESDCAKALAYSKKALLENSESVVAMALAGLALLGIGRPQRASNYVEQAFEFAPNEPMSVLAKAELAKANGDMIDLLAYFERLCSIVPNSWESNYLFGRSLLAFGMQEGDEKSIHRALYHLIAAKDLNIIGKQKSNLFKDIGVACLHTGRYAEAERYFQRLQENPNYKKKARYHLGFVAYHLGKYNNAINHFRQCIEAKNEDPKILARIAACWFHLREFDRAKRACNQTMIREPFNLMARQILGLCLLEEGSLVEAARVFRETLKEYPEDMESYREIVRIRRLGGDNSWLSQALETEVSYYDRQPLGGDIDASILTLQRIQVILDEFQEAGSVHLSTLLRAIEYTQDEHLRFRLWEAAQTMLRSYMAYEYKIQIEEPGKNYGTDLGEGVACLWDEFETQELIGGLAIQDSDLEQAATVRYSPAHDVEQHWKNLDKEKQSARVYQALILLCLGLKNDEEGLEIVRKWSSGNDVDMKLTAHLALIISGEVAPLTALKQHARTRPKQEAYHELKKAMDYESIKPKNALFLTKNATCSCCGKKAESVDLIMKEGVHSICTACVQELYEQPENYEAPDDAFCHFCGASHFETDNLYSFKKVRICDGCVQMFLSEQSRLLVDGYLSSFG